MLSVKNPSKEQFAMQVAKAIFSVNGKTYNFDARKFALVASSNEVVNLKNLYHEHCACPKADRPDDIRKIATVFGQPPELPKSFEEAKAQLRPKILPRSKLEFDELKGRIEGCEVTHTPHEPIGSHLCSTIVYSTEHSMIFVTDTQLEEWGVTFKQAMEVACENVDAATIAWSVIGEHLHSSTSGDNYDSSRIMLVDQIRTLEVAGSHVAVVPNRETVFVVGSEDHDIKIMFELTSKVTENKYRLLCPLPLKLRDGKWLDWEPPKNHLLRPLYDELERNFLGGLYQKQQELLEQLAHTPSIALFTLMRLEPVGSFSFCCWREGVDLLLPKTNLIVFGDAEGGIVAHNTWEHVMAIVGDSVVADDSFYPTLFRVRQFPTDEQLKKIGNIFPGI